MIYRPDVEVHSILRLPRNKGLVSNKTRPLLCDLSHVIFGSDKQEGAVPAQFRLCPTDTNCADMVLEITFI